MRWITCKHCEMREICYRYVNLVCFRHLSTYKLTRENPRGSFYLKGTVSRKNIEILLTLFPCYC